MVEKRVEKMVGCLAVHWVGLLVVWMDRTMVGRMAGRMAAKMAVMMAGQ